MASEILAPIVSGLITGAVGSASNAAAKGINRAAQAITRPRRRQRARRQRQPPTRGNRRRNGPRQRRIKAPTAVGTIATTGAPKVGSGPATSHLPVMHREYIFNVESSSTFNTWTFPLQPGDPVTFPWLARMANLYERYKMRRCTFGYEPCCASTAIGSVVLAFDYDAEDSAPSSFLDATSIEAAVHGQVWAPLANQVDPNRVHGSFAKLYTRNGQIEGTDLKTYDGGALILGVSDCSGDGDLIGRLFVDYVIELHTPQGAGDDHTVLYATCETGLTATSLLDTVVSDPDSLATGTFRFDEVSSVFYWPHSGDFLINWKMVGTDLVGNMNWTACDGEYGDLFIYNIGTVKMGASTARVNRGDVFKPEITSATTITDISWNIVPALFHDNF